MQSISISSPWLVSTGGRFDCSNPSPAPLRGEVSHRFAMIGRQFIVVPRTWLLERRVGNGWRCNVWVVVVWIEELVNVGHESVEQVTFVA